MTFTKFSCQIRIMKIENNDDNNEKTQEAMMILLRNCSDIKIKVRTRWAIELMKHFEQIRKSQTFIRSWNFVVKLNESVECLKMSTLTNDLCENYFVRFQISYMTLITKKKSEKSICSQWLVCFTKSCLKESRLRNWSTMKCSITSWVKIFSMTPLLYSTHHLFFRIETRSSRKS